MGVDAAGVGGAMLGEGVDVGRLEFGGLAVFKDIGHDGVFGRELREGLFVGFELAGFCLLGLFHELHFTEENFAQLFG